MKMVRLYYNTSLSTAIGKNGASPDFGLITVCLDVEEAEVLNFKTLPEY